MGVLSSLFDFYFADKMDCVSLDENCFLLKSVSISNNVQVLSYLLCYCCLILFDVSLISSLQSDQKNYPCHFHSSKQEEVQ